MEQEKSGNADGTRETPNWASFSSGMNMKAKWNVIYAKYLYMEINENTLITVRSNTRQYNKRRIAFG